MHGSIIEDVVVPIVVFGGFGFIIKIILDYFTRKRLIEKGLTDENVKHLYFEKTLTQSASSLKWGLILFLVGLVIIILQILPYYIAGEVYFGAMLIAAGAGLLIYYFIAAVQKSLGNNVDNPSDR